MSRDIVFLAASASPESRSSFVARAVAAWIERAGFAAPTSTVHDFDPADVLLARSSAPTVQAFVRAVTRAEAIVWSTPVYKASYAGALKAIIDFIPPDALVGKAALGIATTKLPAHAGEVERAFHGLFAFFRVRAGSTLVVLDDEMRVDPGAIALAPAAEDRVAKAAGDLVAAIEEGARQAVTP
jgi:FMN reductase